MVNPFASPAQPVREIVALEMDSVMVSQQAANVSLGQPA